MPIPVQTDRLTEAFGSSKKRRAMASRLQNMIDSEELGGTVAGAVQNVLNQSQEEISELQCVKFVFRYL